MAPVDGTYYIFGGINNYFDDALHLDKVTQRITFDLCQQNQNNKWYYFLKRLKAR